MNVKATRQIGSNFKFDFFEDTFLQLKVLKAVCEDVRIEIFKTYFQRNANQSSHYPQFGLVRVLFDVLRDFVTCT